DARRGLAAHRCGVLRVCRPGRRRQHALALVGRTARTRVRRAPWLAVLGLAARLPANSLPFVSLTLARELGVLGPSARRRIAAVVGLAVVGNWGPVGSPRALVAPFVVSRRFVRRFVWGAVRPRRAPFVAVVAARGAPFRVVPIRVLVPLRALAVARRAPIGPPIRRGRVAPRPFAPPLPAPPPPPP